ncbi:MAG TPA: hypothetical protein VMU32_04595 [Solirubrobacteraceae bacterium]|nr:hypothetical protein [Solirubrobacteraceae bacterium]
MSVVGVVLAYWLVLAAVAFAALTVIGRLSARGDGEAELGIVADAEVRVILGGAQEQRASLEARLAHLALPCEGRAR